MKTADMEIRLAHYFGYRENLVVPNVHWGFNMHECDLLVVTQAGYCTEVEIKVSRADVKADQHKTHGHESNIIKKLWFAVPEKVAMAPVGGGLHECMETIPERAGIMVVTDPMHPDDLLSSRIKIFREPQPQKVRKLTDEERYKVARLGAIRIWRLKGKLNGG